MTWSTPHFLWGFEMRHRGGFMLERCGRKSFAIASCCPRLCGLGYPGLSSLGDQVRSQPQTAGERGKRTNKEAIWVSREDGSRAVLCPSAAPPLPTLQQLPDSRPRAGSPGPSPAGWAQARVDSKRRLPAKHQHCFARPGPGKTTNEQGMSWKWKTQD